MPHLPARLVLLLASLTAGCAHHVVGPPPHQDPQGWSRVRAAHFDLLSDAPESRQDEVARELESTYAVIHDTFFRDAKIPRVEVLLFQNTGYLQEIFGQDIAAVHLPKEGGGSVILLANYPDMDESEMAAASEQRRIVAHELVHMFINAAAPRAPVWFHEGFATYLESVELRGEQAFFGLRSRIAAPIIAEGRWVPLATMAQAKFMDHHGIEALTHYATAWAYLHYLLNGDGGAHMRRFLAIWRVMDGAQPGEDVALAALQAPFPEVALDQLDGRVRDYAVAHLGARTDVTGMRVDVPRSALEPAVERSPADRDHVRELCKAVYALKDKRKQ
jgi:hypothetical protein